LCRTEHPGIVVSAPLQKIVLEIYCLAYMIAKGGKASPITLVQVLAVLCLAFLCAPALQGLSQEDAVDWPRLERGDILVATATSRSGTPGLRCLLLVSGSRAELFSRIRDPLFFEASYRNIEELRVLRTYPDGADIEFVLDAIVRRVRYTVARTIDDEKYEVDWSRIAGDLKDISGL
jgi:hypothetical protein